MANIKGWRMVREDSGGEVYPGTTQLDSRGKEWRVLGAARAPEGASTGRVLVEDAEGVKNGFYPHVFGLKIVPAEAEPEGAEALFAALGADFGGNIVQETAKELTMEGIDHMVEGHGIPPTHAIGMTVMASLMENATEAIMAGIMMAHEHGRRQGVREAQQGN